MTGQVERKLTVEAPSGEINAEVEVPGDKSISHRAVILGSLAQGTTRITNFLTATDCLATVEAMRGLGIEVEQCGREVTVRGQGLEGLRRPSQPLNCGGSGTTMRLLAGLLAGQSFTSVLVGSEQLSRRPMGRVAVPLRNMGATVIATGPEERAPLQITGGGLRSISYAPPVASAQVKSAILLAGLYADGTTTVRETIPTRDHTERMLKAMGTDVVVEDGAVRVRRSGLRAISIRVPGDPSSAAFLLAAAAIVPGSQILVRGVGIGPGRTGFLQALARMGAEVSIENEREENGEPVADLRLRHRPLAAVIIGAEEVPSLIDELPLLAVVATQAEGVTEVHGAAELRVKETDRIATTAEELSRMGAAIEALPDGFRIHGPSSLLGATVNSHGDHRLAMSLAIAGLAASGETIVENTACVDDSFPGFEIALAALISRSTHG